MLDAGQWSVASGQGLEGLLAGCLAAVSCWLVAIGRA